MVIFKNFLLHCIQILWFVPWKPYTLMLICIEFLGNSISVSVKLEEKENATKNCYLNSIWKEFSEASSHLSLLDYMEPMESKFYVSNFLVMICVLWIFATVNPLVDQLFWCFQILDTLQIWMASIRILLKVV